MIIGYIKEEKQNKKLFKRIEIRNFYNNYIIAIYDKDSNKVKQKLIKYIAKLNINSLVFSKELEKEFKNEICMLLQKQKIEILNGRKLMELMEFDIIKYIFNKSNKKMKDEEIYIVFKKDEKLRLNFLQRFIENFKIINIVTNDIEKLTNIQNNLLANEGILISVSNNKKKALKRAKYILNVNLTKAELERYKINRNAIIINIKEEVVYDNIGFDGVNIKYFSIECPDEYMEEFEQIGDNFDIAKLYESKLLNENSQVMGQYNNDNLYRKINQDNIKITGLIGNNGFISEEELQKIHNINLDKMRKLV